VRMIPTHEIHGHVGIDEDHGSRSGGWT
jgi:hypothetical protein